MLIGFLSGGWRGRSGISCFLFSVLVVTLPVVFLSGCGLFMSGPEGETAPLFYGFTKAAKYVPTSLPTDPMGMISWVIGIGAAAVAGVGGTLHQYRKISKLTKKVNGGG